MPLPHTSKRLEAHDIKQRPNSEDGLHSIPAGSSTQSQPKSVLNKAERKTGADASATGSSELARLQKIILEKLSAIEMWRGIGKEYDGHSALASEVLEGLQEELFRTQRAVMAEKERLKGSGA